MKKVIILCAFLMSVNLSFGLTNKGQKKEVATNRFFNAEVSFMGVLDDRFTPYSYTLSLGYELQHPRFEYFGIEAKVGFYYVKFTSQALKSVETNGTWTKVPNELHYNAYSNCLNIGVAPKIYFPLENDLIESLFISNEFNWIKPFSTVRMPNMRFDNKFSGSSSMLFHYELKFGVKFAPIGIREKTKFTFWLGCSSLNLKKHIRSIIPTQYPVGNIKFDVSFGLSLNF